MIVNCDKTLKVAMLSKSPTKQKCDSPVLNFLANEYQCEYHYHITWFQVIWANMCHALLYVLNYKAFWFFSFVSDQ